MVLTVFAAVVGWLGWKVKQTTVKHDELEKKQDDRLDTLERRQNTLEKDFQHALGVLDERTQATRDDIKIIKEYIINKDE